MATIMEAFDPSIVAVAAGESSSSKKTTRTPTVPMFARGDLIEEMGTTSVVPRPLSFHPLQNSWTMWLFTHDRSKPWEENQHSIYTFKTVEEFWGLYHNIAQPTELPSGCDYSLFKVSVANLASGGFRANKHEWQHKYSPLSITDVAYIKDSRVYYYFILVLGRHQAYVGGREEQRWRPLGPPDRQENHDRITGQ